MVTIRKECSMQYVDQRPFKNRNMRGNNAKLRRDGHLLFVFHNGSYPLNDEFKVMDYRVHDD